MIDNVDKEPRQMKHQRRERAKAGKAKGSKQRTQTNRGRPGTQNKIGLRVEEPIELGGNDPQYHTRLCCVI